MNVLNPEIIQVQIKTLLKLILSHSILRLIEAHIESIGQDWGRNFSSNCSLPTFKSIEAFID